MARAKALLKNMAKSVLTLFLVGGGVLFPVGPASAAELPENLDAQIEIQERARKSLTRQIEQYNATAKKKAKEAQSLLNTITTLRQSAQVTQQQIALLELRSAKLKGSMQQLNKDIARVNRSLEALLQELQARLLNIYKYSAQEELNVFLAARSAHDALTMAYMLDRMAKQDQKVIEDLAKNLKELDEAKRNLERSRSQLALQTKELGARRDEYASTISRTSAVLSGVQRERKDAVAAAREVELAQREIGQKIIALTQKKKSMSRPVPAAPRPGAAKPSSDYAYLAKGSLLDWPLRGPVIAPFGSRKHPVFKTTSFNSGIDIRAASSAPVKAAGPGEVLFKGWLRGFGQVVILDHGNNLSTVYAHLASTKVNEGDTVRPGTVIGAVGNTGTTSEYSLHFEVRHGGEAKNPMQYLKRL